MNVKMLMAAVLGLGLIGATGCGKSDPTAPKPEPKKDEDHGHGAGPHGGIILELGEYHGEFKADHAKKEATVWLLKEDAKSAARLNVNKVRLVVSNTNPKITIDLLPTDAAPDGTASVFTGKDAGFGVEMEYKGTVTVQIDGKPFSDDFDEKPEPKKK